MRSAYAFALFGATGVKARKVSAAAASFANGFASVGYFRRGQKGIFGFLFFVSYLNTRHFVSVFVVAVGNEFEYVFALLERYATEVDRCDVGFRSGVDYSRSFKTFAVEFCFDNGSENVFRGGFVNIRGKKRRL